MPVFLSRAGLAALALVASATLASARGQSSLPGLFLPGEVAGFHFTGTKDYETREPGMGYSARYEKAPLWADIYSYDFRRKDLPAHYDSATSQAELSDAEAAIAQAVSLGYYKSGEKTGDFVVSDKAGARFDCARYRIVTKDEKADDSVLCLTNRDGRFIKIRISGSKGSLGEDVARSFIAFWLKPEI